MWCRQDIYRIFISETNPMQIHISIHPYTTSIILKSYRGHHGVIISSYQIIIINGVINHHTISLSDHDHDMMMGLQGVDTENQRWSLETDLHSNSLRWNLNWEKYFWITLELWSHFLNAIQNSRMVCFEEIGQKFNRMRMIWQVFSLSDGHQGNSEKPSETGKTNLKNENMLKKNLKRLRANGKKLAAQVEWRAFLVRRSRRWPGLRDPRHHYQMVTFPMTLTIIIHKDIQGIIMVLFQW